MLRRWHWLALLAVLTGFVACFSLSFQNGTIHCSSDPQRPCPAGYSCFADYCWSRVTDLSLVGDGSAVDAGTD